MVSVQVAERSIVPRLWRGALGKMWYVYILKSLKDNKFYIGSTGNLILRIEKHNSGGNISTRNRRPLKLIYSETFEIKKQALQREKQIKSYKGGEAFKKLIL